jgi:hypothetical protein
LRLFDELNEFCRERKNTSFMLDRNLESADPNFYRSILRLSDFRLIHRISSSRSNPTDPGKTFDTYMLDIGSYSHMRKLTGRLKEIDLTKNSADLVDELRTAPIFSSPVS